MKNYQITQWCANFIRQQVTEGDFCIDATMGNGNDTLLLSQLCKTTGKVLAFDIQKQALAATREKLAVFFAAIMKDELCSRSTKFFRKTN